MAWQEIENELDRAVQQGLGSAIAAGVRTTTGKTWECFAGKTRSDAYGLPIAKETLFDLASLTKIFATTTLLARYVDQGKISLQEDVRSLFTELTWNSAMDTRIQTILIHQSGFPWWMDFSDTKSKEEIFKRIAEAPLAYSPGSTVIYSDLGFIALGEYLQRKFGQRLQDLVKKEHEALLDSVDFFYKPLEHGIDKKKIVATQDIPARGGVIQGEVHDGNTFKLGGVAAHAGLFGTLSACLDLSELWLKAALGQADFFLSQETALLFLKKYDAKDGKVRALGWDAATPPQSMAGKNVSLNSFGHSGYTGTSVFLDLDRKAAVVLLTNRVHPKDEKAGIVALRPMFHDMVWKELDR